MHTWDAEHWTPSTTQSRVDRFWAYMRETHDGLTADRDEEEPGASARV